METGPQIRIGELSRRVGVQPETLRAWERRYGILEPQRTEGGFRLYSNADEARVRTMTVLMRQQGMSAAEAATIARSGTTPTEVIPAAESDTRESDPEPDLGIGSLIDALDRFDGVEADRILDAAIARLSLDAFLDWLILPALREVGSRWERGESTIAQEHFASNHLRGRLLGLGRGWSGGAGPLALLACPPGERHDLGLLACGIALRERGWRIAFIGADAPIETISATAEVLDPAIVLICSLRREPLVMIAEQLSGLSSKWAVALAGSGADAGQADSVGAAHLPGGPVDGARWLDDSRRASLSGIGSG